MEGRRRNIEETVSRTTSRTGHRRVNHLSGHMLFSSRPPPQPCASETQMTSTAGSLLLSCQLSEANVNPEPNAQ